MIDAEERTRQGTPALSTNQQGLAGETGKDLCTGSALSWIAVVASNRFPPCILPLLPSVLNGAEKWAFSVRFQTMWLQLSEPSHSFLPRSTWEYKPWQWLTRSDPTVTSDCSYSCHIGLLGFPQMWHTPLWDLHHICFLPGVVIPHLCLAHLVPSSFAYVSPSPSCLPHCL